MENKKIYTIYKATNELTGMAYIGFDSNWPNRIKSHRSSSDRNPKQYFHHAIAKYGFENFRWDVFYK